jgi:hypothetical protein
MADKAGLPAQATLSAADKGRLNKKKHVPAPSGAASSLIKLAVYSALMFCVPSVVFYLSYSGYLDGTSYMAHSSAASKSVLSSLQRTPLSLPLKGVYARTFGVPADENRAVVSGILAIIAVHSVRHCCSPCTM